MQSYTSNTLVVHYAAVQGRMTTHSPTSSTVASILKVASLASSILTEHFRSLALDRYSTRLGNISSLPEHF